MKPILWQAPWIRGAEQYDFIPQNRSTNNHNNKQKHRNQTWNEPSKTKKKKIQDISTKTNKATTKNKQKETQVHMTGPCPFSETKIKCTLNEMCTVQQHPIGKSKESADHYAVLSILGCKQGRRPKPQPKNRNKQKTPQKTKIKCGCCKESVLFFSIIVWRSAGERAQI